MNRRAAIRNVVIISAGAGMLPSCLHHDRSSIVLKNFKISETEEHLLSELVETIIPKTKDFVGAKDLRAHEFLLTMLDDCASPGEQAAFKEGMKSFEEYCQGKWNKTFPDCSPEQRNALLHLMEKKQDIPGAAVNFYGTVKRYTLQSFTSSREYMTGVKKFKIVPGPDFKGCVPVRNS